MVKRRKRKTGSSEPRRIAGVLDDLLSRLSISRQYRGWSFVSDWPEIVGEFYAERSEAVRYDNGTLFVSVTNDALRQEFSIQKEMILQKIRSLPYGSAIKQIRLIRGRKG